MRVLNLGGGDVDAVIPMGPMISPVMVAPVRVEQGIGCRRITDPVVEGRAVGHSLGGRCPTFGDSRNLVAG